MWFRRKKKTDPDSALSETLRSLQTLLENEDSVENEQRVAPKMEPNVGRFDPPMEQSDTASVPALHSQRANSDTSKPRLSSTGIPQRKSGTGSANQAQPEPTGTQVESSDERQKKPNAAEASVGPFEIDIDDDLFEDPGLKLQGYPDPDDSPTLDSSIPTLQNVVHIPSRDALNDAMGPGPELHDSTHRHTGMSNVEIAVVQIVIDECMAYLSQRLAERKLASLSEDQEEELREVLAAILEAGNTAGSE